MDTKHLFDSLCAVTNELETLATPLMPGPTRNGLIEQVAALDSIIDSLEDGGDQPQTAVEGGVDGN